MDIIPVVLGGLITIATAIFIEWLRKPRLELNIDPAVENNYDSRFPARVGRFTYLRIKNKELPLMVRWMARNPALQCHGTISFHDMSGQNIFGREMPIRWSDAPEPVTPAFTIGGTHVIVHDPARIAAIERRDIYPGESERVDIVARFDSDTACHGWTNANYFTNPQWRNPDWILPQGNYLAQVSVVTSGQKCVEVFRIINSSTNRGDLRIEPKQPNDAIH